jgi:hypothetical protein
VLVNYWEFRLGTAEHPIILNAADGAHTAVFHHDVNMYNCSHVYFLGVDIVNDPAGDAFHCELCHYILLRDMEMAGGNRFVLVSVSVCLCLCLFV